MRQFIKTIDGIPVSGIQTNQFKTLQFQCQFTTQLNKESAPKRALLAYLLRAASKDYPSRQAMTRHLQNQYGAHIRTGCRKLGNSHVMTFFVSMINPEFTLHQEDLLATLFETLHGMVYHPHFDEAIFEEEKMAMIDYLLESASDPLKQAMLDLQDKLYENDPYQTRSLGRVEDYETLTLEDIKESYHAMITSDTISVSWVGDIPPTVIHKLIKQTLKQPSSLHTCTFLSPPYLDRANPTTITAHKDIHQAKLLMTYRTDIVYTSNDYTAMLLFNTLLGGHSDSLLFNIVRTKASMCYQIGSSYDSYKGALLIYTGIDSKNAEKVTQLTRQVIESVQNNTFDITDLSLAQKAIETALVSGLDSPYSLLNHLTKAQFFNQAWSTDTMIEQVYAVTRQDIVRVANTLIEDLTYLVKGGTQ